MKHNHAPSFKQKGNFEITNVSLLEIYDRNYFTSPCLPVTYLYSPVAPSHLNITEAMANVCKDLSSMANSQLEHFCCLTIYIVISVEVSFGETFRKANVFVLCTISGENTGPFITVKYCQRQCMWDYSVCVHGNKSLDVFLIVFGHQALDTTQHLLVESIHS